MVQFTLRLSGLLWSGMAAWLRNTVLLCQYGKRAVSFGVCGVGGARLPPCPSVVELVAEKVLANLGDDAASAKVSVMGERCAEPGLGFCTRPAALPMPDDRILRSVWSLLFPGEGIPLVYEALRNVLELSAVGRLCLLAAMLEDWVVCWNSSGVLFWMCIASMLLARLLVDELRLAKASSPKTLAS